MNSHNMFYSEMKKIISITPYLQHSARVPVLDPDSLIDETWYTDQGTDYRKTNSWPTVQI